MTKNQNPEALGKLKRILIVGSGGRENSIAWALSKNQSIEQIYVCPGNGGTANFEKCNCLKPKSEDAKTIIEECQQLGIPVDPPNINTSRGRFVAKDGRVQYGMSAIKGVGDSAIQHIVEQRATEGKFTSIFDFASRVDVRVCNRRTLESLIEAGTFDTLYDNRAQLFQGVEDILSYANRKQEEKRLNQVNLFGGSGSDTALQEPKLPSIPNWTSIERLNRERELIGFYLSGHPLERHKEDIQLFSSHTLSSDIIDQLNHDSELNVIGIVTSKRVITDKKGRPIAFLMVEDRHSSMEMAVFSQQFDQYAALLEVDNVLWIKGRYSRRDRGNSMIVEAVERVENLREKHQDKLRLSIRLHTHNLESSSIDRLVDFVLYIFLKANHEI